jgi:predicted PurR-regulated permease PerM
MGVAGPLRLLLWAAVAAVVFFALYLLGPVLRWALDVLSPFLIALIIAYVLHPIVTFVQRKLRLGRLGGLIVLALLALAALAGAVLWVAPVLIRQVKTLIDTLRVALPEKLALLTSAESGGEFMEMLALRIQQVLGRVQEAIQKWMEDPGATIQPVAEGSMGALSGVAQFLAGGVGAVVNIFGALATFGFIVVIAVYYLLEMDSIPRVMRRAIPLKHRERVWQILVKVDESVGGFLRGQLLACVGVGALTTVLLLLIGLQEYALLIGVMAGLLNFIPYLGPVTGFTPALMWVLFAGEFTSLSQRGIHLGLLVAGFAVIQAIDGFVFQPYIVGKRAQLHPLAVMLALAVGVQAGIGGMVLAVPAFCAFKVLWIELYWKHQAADGATPTQK